jgi:hypothetical protein
MKKFVFDIDKTVAAAAYLTKKKGGTISAFELLKMMYAAERLALLEWHRPITGDSFCSMRKGIVLSRTYDLIKHQIMSGNSDMVKWAKHFSPREANMLRLLEEPDFDFLSDREKEVLDKGFDQITQLIKKHGAIADVLHAQWPEWKNPGNGSIPVDPADILAQGIDDEDELEKISMEIQAVQDAKASLQHTS